MRTTTTMRFLVLTSVFGLFAVLHTHAQMKIGNNPTQIQPASILELESPNQALRLSQGDTADVNDVLSNLQGIADIHDMGDAAVLAAEGMLLYQNSDHSLYMRVGGYWRQIVSSANVDSAFWRPMGNYVQDSASGYLGSLNVQPLTLGINNTGYIIIHSDGTIAMLGDSMYFKSDAEFGQSVAIADSLTVNNGTFKLSDSLYVNSGLAIHDSIVIKGLEEALPADKFVLMLGSNGVVRRIHVDSLKGENVSTIIGGSGNIRLYLGDDAGDTKGPWVDSLSAAVDSILILNIPSAAGTESMAVRGLVDTVAQSFAGSKSFRDSLAVGTLTTPNSVLDIRGNVSMAATTINTDFNMNLENNAAFRTIICDVSGKNESPSPSITIMLPTATGLDGRIYTIKKIGDSGENQIGAFVKVNGAFADGAAETNLYNNWSSLTIQALSNEWHIIGH